MISVSYLKDQHSTLIILFFIEALVGEILPLFVIMNVQLRSLKRGDPMMSATASSYQNRLSVGLWSKSEDN